MKRKLEKMALQELKKLPGKEQQRLNKLKRLSTAPPSVQFEDKRRKEKHKKGPGVPEQQ